MQKCGMPFYAIAIKVWVGSGRCRRYRLENGHMEKLKPRAFKRPSCWLNAFQKLFFFSISETVRGGCRLVCSRVQMAWLTTVERNGMERERERGTDRERDTYPWQCFLFVEGVLGFDGRLSGAVGEECATCNRATAHIPTIRMTQNL